MQDSTTAALHRLRQLDVPNPFGSPIYYIESTTSTMDEARRLAAAYDTALASQRSEAPYSLSTLGLHRQIQGSQENQENRESASKEPRAHQQEDSSQQGQGGLRDTAGCSQPGIHGTVVMADVQTAGRGRAAGRRWVAAAGESLLCTLILQYPTIQAIPAALPLRLGVALTLSIEALWPELAGRTRVKWPNDVFIDGKKAAGILCEGDGRYVYAGIGVNLNQKNFPAELAHRGTSIVLALHQRTPPPDRAALLISLLTHCKALLQTGPGNTDWHRELEQRLYKRGEPVRFLAGSVDDPTCIEGFLEGVSETGELRIQDPESGAIRTFVTGELDVY
ncbi:MAG: biotin--[acetyl-CoA-carboxylase] ligase [Termitinemataceae bacterium]